MTPHSLILLTRIASTRSYSPIRQEARMILLSTFATLAGIVLIALAVIVGAAIATGAIHV